MSVNYLERKILQRGYQLSRIDHVEYGTDAITSESMAFLKMAKSNSN
jgi:hypothetical protein